MTLPILWRSGLEYSWGWFPFDLRSIIWKLNHNTYIFISQNSKFDFAVTLFLFPSSMYSLILYFFVSFISFCFILFHGAKTRLLLSFEAVLANEDSAVTWDKSFKESPFFHSFPLWQSCITSSEHSCNRYYSLWPLMAALNNKNKTLFFKLGKQTFAIWLYNKHLTEVWLLLLYFFSSSQFLENGGSTPLMDV